MNGWKLLDWHRGTNLKLIECEYLTLRVNSAYTSHRRMSPSKDALCVWFVHAQLAGAILGRLTVSFKGEIGVGKYCRTAGHQRPSLTNVCPLGTAANDLILTMFVEVCIHDILLYFTQLGQVVYFIDPEKNYCIIIKKKYYLLNNSVYSELYIYSLTYWSNIPIKRNSWKLWKYIMLIKSYI